MSASAGKESKRIKLLLADDHAVVRSGTRELLERQPDLDIVGEAADGEEAVRLTHELQPDVVVMDVRMPKMTGFEACEALKADEQTKDIPVIFLSAKGQEIEVKTGLDLGAVDYFLKPFAPDKLTKRVSEILSEHGKL